MVRVSENVRRGEEKRRGRKLRFALHGLPVIRRKLGRCRGAVVDVEIENLVLVQK